MVPVSVPEKRFQRFRFLFRFLGTRFCRFLGLPAKLSIPVASKPFCQHLVPRLGWVRTLVLRSILAISRSEEIHCDQNSQRNVLRTENPFDRAKRAKLFELKMGLAISIRAI